MQAAGASPIDIRGDDRRRTGGLILALPRNPLESRCDLFSCKNDMFGVLELAAIECHQTETIRRSEQATVAASDPHAARLALQSADEPAESARAVRGSVSLVRLTQIC